MCKISVRNDVIKDILKKNNDVHRISDGTIGSAWPGFCFIHFYFYVAYLHGLQLCGSRDIIHNSMLKMRKKSTCTFG